MNMTDTTSNVQSQDEIDFKKQIGKGSYAEVWLAKWNGQEVAAKIIHPELINKENRQRAIDHFIKEFRKEWEVLQKLDHPNIVKMHTFLLPWLPNETPAIIMELMHGDLLQYIENSTSTPKVSPSKVLSIALGVAEGLEYLHGLKPPVVHRDIATKNILLTVDGQPKIADLGVAKVFAAGKDDFATAGPGTPVYAAPETYLDTVKDKAKYGVKIDIYSFGVTLLAMVVGHEPVVVPKEKKIDGSKISEIERREEDIKQIKGRSSKKIILECLQDESSRRPHAHGIVTKLKQMKQNMIETEIGQIAKCNPNAEFKEVPTRLSYDHVFKVTFLGSSGVGKSCLVKLLKDPTYSIEYQRSTIGVNIEFYSYKYNSQHLQLQIMDTGGQERFHSMPTQYMRNSDGVFLVYDISDKKSFEMLPYWLEIIDKNTPDNCNILLVGNKEDLRKINSNEVLVPQENALRLANEYWLPYIETSAKEIHSINSMLQKMVEMLISTPRKEGKHKSIVSFSKLKGRKCCD